MALDRTGFKRRRVEARVLFDGTLIDQHAALDAALTRAIRDEIRHDDDDGSLTETSPRFDLIDQINLLEARIATEEQLFVFEGIGESRWQILAAEHPPTPVDLDLGSPFDPRTFPPAAIAATCVQCPAGDILDVDDAQWLFDSLDHAEWSKLWGACLLANMGQGDRPKSLIATVAAITSARRSTIAPRAASRTRSSSHGTKKTSKRR